VCDHQEAEDTDARPGKEVGVSHRALLTARDVAEQLGVHTETVLRWVRRGMLPGFRLPGGALRFRENDLERWFAERATPAKEVDSHPRPASPG
jgi:excisionase family DNA binding protein